MRTAKTLPLVLFVLLSACGGGSGGNGGNRSDEAVVVPNGNLNSPLLGEWQTVGCEIEQDGQFSGDRTHIFNDDLSGFRIISTYTGADCSEPAFEIIDSFVYRIGDSLEIPGRGLQTEIDFFSSEPLLVLNSQLAVDNFNALAICEFTQWELGVSYEIPGCSVGRTEALSSQPQFGIFLIENDEFLYGGTELSFTAENRPTQLDSSPALMRLHAAESGTPVFPDNVEGFWVLQGTDSFLRFAEDGAWLSFFPDTERNCHMVDRAFLQPAGNDSYNIVANGQLLQLIPGNNTLTVIFPTSTTEFLLVPANRNQLSFLDYCPG